MKKKYRIILLIAILIFIFNTIFLPSIKSFMYQSIYKDLIERINQHALSSNIKIIQLQYSDQENSSVLTVSAGASGVIIHREENKYYALTAEHVIRELEDVDKTQIIVLGYDQLDMNDYLSKGGKLQSFESYYKQFPEGKVEYASEEYDLALISFYADEDYTVLPNSQEMPKYGELIASMSNPSRKRNIVTVGRISTIKPRPFGDEA
ncbi:MAG TPA: trypsin-like peptidase domain-containing protein [Clostridiales bacterium]|jgi:serine protease Do|nr:trypsin-like peptidase domain-containing protein [Clostridiales bacterium]